MKHFFISLLALAGTSLTAQTNYSFSHSSSAYNPLSGGNVVLNGSWDDTIVMQPIGFSFSFMGNTYSNVYVDTWGVLEFDMGMQYVFPGLSADFVSVPGSIISSQTTGTAPNREFIVDFSNVGLFNDASGNARCSFQLVLKENGSVLETRVGPSSGVQSSFFDDLGPQCGVLDVNMNTFAVNHGLMLDGQPSSPNAAMPANLFSAPSLDAYPSNGKVFTFAPQLASGVEEHNQTAVTFYPNPADHEICISNPEQDELLISLYGSDGRLMRDCGLTYDNIYRISIDDLAPGVYFVSITGKAGRAQYLPLVKN